MFASEKVTEDVQTYFRNYAAESYALGIPMAEAIYALILMRRYMWLNPDFQDMFIHALAHHQAVDSLMSVMLLMDHAGHDVTRYYHERLEDKP
ncbi:MAG: hypothetical protein WC347_08665 [Smithellaceae bacterium]|jgi:hypothetical protein